MAGYLNPGYAESLAEFGRPLHLPRSGGWLLERPIHGTPYKDAMGCYPLFFCADWSRLSEDLLALDGDIISVCLVADPFGDYRPADLKACFDAVNVTKSRYVIDTRRCMEDYVSGHHKHYARKALKSVAVELCDEPTAYIDEWTTLYSVLCERHKLHGIKAFSRAAFSRQLALPGLVMFRAVAGGVTVGLDLWYQQGDVAYGHLAAFSPLGYQLRASYALKWRLIDYFSSRVRWIDLGGVPGTGSSPDNGLAKFKQGWSTDSRPTYFCGKILNRPLYAELVQRKGTAGSTYFPAYRQGEFA
jgi:hypothetical protein